MAVEKLRSSWEFLGFQSFFTAWERWEVPLEVDAGTKISSGLMQRLLCVQRHQRSGESWIFLEDIRLVQSLHRLDPRWIMNLCPNSSTVRFLGAAWVGCCPCKAIDVFHWQVRFWSFWKQSRIVDHQSWAFPVFQGLNRNKSWEFYPSMWSEVSTGHETFSQFRLPTRGPSFDVQTVLNSADAVFDLLDPV